MSRDIEWLRARGAELQRNANIAESVGVSDGLARVLAQEYNQRDYGMPFEDFAEIFHKTGRLPQPRSLLARLFRW
jgi:hypothetical protein